MAGRQSRLDPVPEAIEDATRYQREDADGHDQANAQPHTQSVHAAGGAPGQFAVSPRPQPALTSRIGNGHWQPALPSHSQSPR
jgi:hypothetical protein